MKQFTIKTKYFILRPLRKTDAVSLVKYANNKKVSQFLTVSFPYPYLLSNAQKFIKLNIKEINKENSRFLTFGIEINNEIIGVIGIHLSKANYSAEIGFWLGEEYWGKKIMSRAIKEIAKYCFDELKLKRIEARFIKDNKASQRVLKKNKFKIEGLLRKALFKNNKFLDLILMAIIK